MIYQLIYTSRIRPGINAAHLLQISDKANINNVSRNITGVMLSSGDRVLQILEGPKDDVIHLFREIKADTRHSDVIIMASGHNELREFEGQSMVLKFVHTRPGMDAFEALISESTEFCSIAA